MKVKVFEANDLMLTWAVAHANEKFSDFLRNSTVRVVSHSTSQSYVAETRRHHYVISVCYTEADRGGTDE
jgi:hypothetical protein